jgi:hypothetical protein
MVPMTLPYVVTLSFLEDTSSIHLWPVFLASILTFTTGVSVIFQSLCDTPAIEDDYDNNDNDDHSTSTMIQRGCSDPFDVTSSVAERENDRWRQSTFASWYPSRSRFSHTHTEAAAAAAASIASATASGDHNQLLNRAETVISLSHNSTSPNTATTIIPATQSSFVDNAPTGKIDSDANDIDRYRRTSSVFSFLYTPSQRSNGGSATTLATPNPYSSPSNTNSETPTTTATISTVPSSANTVVSGRRRKPYDVSLTTIVFNLTSIEIDPVPRN